MAFIFISTDIIVEQYGQLGFLFANVTVGIAWFSSPLAGARVLARTGAIRKCTCE